MCVCVRVYLCVCVCVFVSVCVNVFQSTIDDKQLRFVRLKELLSRNDQIGLAENLDKMEDNLDNKDLNNGILD